MTRMQRYSGEHLGAHPHIVVLGSCKVGNFVVSTPVLQGLRNRFPDAVIGFIGSDVTADFEQQLPAINWRCSWDSPAPDAGLALQQCLIEMRAMHGEVALAVNLDGFNPVTCTLVPWLQPCYVAGGSLKANLRGPLPWGDEPSQRFLADDDWDSEEFLGRYSEEFKSNYIAELFCRLAYVFDFVDCAEITLPFQQPSFSVPDLLIHCTTARAAKVWPFNYWQQIVEEVSAWGWSVGLIGSPPSAQKSAYNAGDEEEKLLASTQLIDLRGRTSLIELAGASRLAKAVISVDAGPLHVAAAVGAPVLGIVGNDVDGLGASPIRLWLPRSMNFERTVSPHSCARCAQERFRNDACLVDGHPCMEEMGAAQVLDWLEKLRRNSEVR